MKCCILKSYSLLIYDAVLLWILGDETMLIEGSQTDYSKETVRNLGIGLFEPMDI